MYAMVDCNNFYVSCERAFQPSLQGRPVVVLSNNDGCAIARSEEVKALDIDMGTPAFKVREKMLQHGVAVFSSNYTLYGDMSRRVMGLLTEFAQNVELYSIDEAFLDLNDMGYTDLGKLGRRIRRRVTRDTGIPVTVGIARTKTLAKMANRLAKKQAVNSFVATPGETELQMLEATGVSDIWGIGHQYARLLLGYGIRNARQLAELPDQWVMEKMTVVGRRLQNELRGIPSIAWESNAPKKKNILTSRSFGSLLTDRAIIREAVANHASASALKARKDGTCARAVEVFLQTNPHRQQDRQYFRSVRVPLEVASNITGEIISHALRGFDIIFRRGYQYMKTGVHLVDLVDANVVQGGLFDTADRSRGKTLMSVMDQVNAVFGCDTVRAAAQGYERRFRLRCEHLSRRYTTHIDEVITINN